MKSFLDLSAIENDVCQKCGDWENDINNISWRWRKANHVTTTIDIKMEIVYKLDVASHINKHNTCLSVLINFFRNVHKTCSESEDCFCHKCVMTSFEMSKALQNAVLANMEAAKILHAHGAQVLLTDRFLWCISSYRDIENETDVLDFLLENGLSLTDNIFGERSACLLNLSIANEKSVRWIKHLIAKGSPLNKVDDNGMTAIHHAINHPKAIHVTKFLIEAGCNVNARAYGETALEVLLREGCRIFFERWQWLTTLLLLLREDNNKNRPINLIPEVKIRLYNGSLYNICREKIRTHLLDLHPHLNVLKRSALLGNVLPKAIVKDLSWEHEVQEFFDKAKKNS